MRRRKSKQILNYFCLLFLFGSITNLTFQNNQFLNLKKIIVLGLDEKENEDLKKKIYNLKLNNIFFINQNQIKNVFETNSLIESYKISKIYPSTLDIKINKTNLLAKINKNGRILFLGSNGKLSEIFFYDKKLPFIFGKPKIQEFLDFKKILDESKFSYDEVKNFYFFPSKRWDVELRNNIILKLPRYNSKASLDHVFDFLTFKNIRSNFTIDARIKNQIISYE